MSETIFALATGRPPAAIAIVRISGATAHGAGAAIAGDLPPPRQAAVRTLRSAVGDILDQALVLRFDGPASATGEDVVEFHCHGGRAVVDAVLSELGRVGGLRLALPGEFTRRAFENGRIDLTEAEGLADLLEAETESQRKAALAMAEGGLRKQVERWQQRILSLSARAEATIDYVEEDDLGSDPGLADDCEALAADLNKWLQRPRMETLREGVRVVLAGPPNTGKSSLLNALVGSDKAIVTELAGTTRDQIEVPVAIAGTPLILVDTAGLRVSEDPIEQIGIERARTAIREADVLLWLGEPDAAPDHPGLIVIHSRADLFARVDVPQGAIPVSAVTGRGLPDLLKTLTSKAGTVLPSEGVLALNRRQSEVLDGARDCLSRAARAPDILILAEELRATRLWFDRLTGRSGIEDVLDHLFGRFCLGK